MKIVHSDIVDDVVVIIVAVAVTIEICRRNPPLTLPPRWEAFFAKKKYWEHEICFRVQYFVSLHHKEMYLVKKKVLSHYYSVAAVYLLSALEYIWFKFFAFFLEKIKIRCVFLTCCCGHSSEIRSVCLMKCASKTLQNLPFFLNKKTHIVFFVLHFVLLY